MKDKKAAKKIIKIAKQNPLLYTKEEVKYAKMVRKRIKREEKQHEREASDSDSRCREAHGVRSKGEQPEEPRQPKRGWFAEVLYKASALVNF